ncbi:MAG TPA: TetR/AcrR family transcriptional regulator [Alcanivorax sp.]|nr:TetR/AcrR family transcriptional regulator [Alcanivorax sp.]HAI35734.1 TetR/AcrR family transcriptional regulator [Alcanivorax sp.]HBP67901.1 TetR/AcrR family transcriptional regulator [Alcanivorax sp.]HCK28094.1 TetR/AcrR family transcriptional regulator [Alcanivorax sp.]|tara:strand:- start:3146 stop:3736 length:591 start_codon:yes stop_codon:yes gene_type:complete
MRKHPRQRRSRQLVDSLIEATGRALVEYGLDHTTTVRIAEIAGVSVGSLYQYFEGKDALVEALMDKLADDIAQGLRRLPLADSAGLRETVDGAIRFGFAVLHSRDGLYLELVRNWHRLPTNRVADALQQHFMELSRLYFIKHYRDYPIEDLQVRVFIVANSVLFTMVRHASQNDALLREDDIAAGLTDMVVGYMTH